MHSSSKVSFRQHNLLESAGGLGKFDVILCRNVLSGMDRSARSRVADSLAAQLMPGGLVILGQGESLIGLTNQLEPSRDFRGTWMASDGTPKSATSAA